MTSLTVSLPLQLLCQLISGSNYSIYGTAVDQSSQPIELPVLPNGYVSHPDIGVAIKVYGERTSWIVAKKQCELDGGNLAVIDSHLKLGYVLKQRSSNGRTHVGILRMYDEQQWVSVKDYLPVLTIPWAEGEPNHEWDCVMILGDKNSLGNLPCTTIGDYVCERPIPRSRIVHRKESVVGEVSIGGITVN